MRSLRTRDPGRIGDTHYAAIARGAILAATAEAERPSLFGPSKASCASEIEVALDAVGWALAEATALLYDALTDLGGAFVPDAGARARDQVREVVEATLTAAVLDALPPPA